MRISFYLKFQCVQTGTKCAKTGTNPNIFSFQNITDLDLDKKRVTFSIPERYMKEFTPDR